MIAEPYENGVLQNNIDRPPPIPRKAVLHRPPVPPMEQNRVIEREAERFDNMEMQRLVRIYSELLDICHRNNIDMPEIGFPEIVVIGSQSAGKSSVLENIVGEEFLPRGSNCVTRNPLLLHLVHVPEDQLVGGERKWAQFKDGDKFGPKLTNFQEVKMEIESRQGDGKRISSKDIVLYVYSPDYLDLVLYDLPGIFRVAVDGQGNDDIEEAKTITNKFIERETTIILAVSAANIDIQDSAAIEYARKADPFGYRTLHVITKVDIVPPGTDITAVLNGSEPPIFPANHGAVGVICRNQEEISKGMSVAACLQKERKYFDEHFYPHIASEHGTQRLQTKVNEILMKKLKDCEPRITSTVNQKIKKYEDLLTKLGEKDKRPMNTQIHEVVQKFSELFKSTIEGSDEKKTKDHTRLVGGALIDELFKEKFGEKIRDMPHFTELTAEKVKIVARNCGGAAPGMFPDSKTFLALMRPEIEQLAIPSLKLVDYVNDVLKAFVINEVGGELEDYKKRYPLLMQKNIELSLTYLEETWIETKDQVETFFAVEKEYFSFAHVDLDEYYQRFLTQIGRTQSFASAVSSGNSTPVLTARPAPPPLVTATQSHANSDQSSLSDFVVTPQFAQPILTSQLTKRGNQPLLLTKIIETLHKDSEKRVLIMLHAYMELTRRMVLEHVPKLIMYHLVNHVKTQLQQYLMEHLNEVPDRLQDLTAEPELVRKNRDDTKKKLNDLNHALDQLTAHYHET